MLQALHYNLELRGYGISRTYRKRHLGKLQQVSSSFRKINITLLTFGSKNVCITKQRKPVKHQDQPMLPSDLLEDSTKIVLSCRVGNLEKSRALNSKLKRNVNKICVHHLSLEEAHRPIKRHSPSLSVS